MIESTKLFQVAELNASRYNKDSSFWFEESLLKGSITPVIPPTNRPTQSFSTPIFWGSFAKEIEVLSRLAMLDSMQNARERAIYPKQQADRYIPFTGKIKDSVQKFPEKAIATPVERYLYPERSL